MLHTSPSNLDSDNSQSDKVCQKVAQDNDDHDTNAFTTENQCDPKTTADDSVNEQDGLTHVDAEGKLVFMFQTKTQIFIII